MRILLVEDNLALSDLIKHKLCKFHIIDASYDLQMAHYFLDTKSYDLLILDLILPDGSGCELCDYLKENKIALPILFLTASVDVKQKISCLRQGDDYLVKPFNIQELEVRVKILLSKISSQEAKHLKNTNFELNQLTHQAYFNGKEMKLNRKEFLLLELFLKNGHRVLSKTTLAEKIWQKDDVVFGNTIETTIANLRRKSNKNLIKTVKGVGYVINSR
ncbi:MAG TPA: response regulator transcription factor [Candidatus Woesebacteria bacterium]|nr:response regulator transcription factor [Candidatus Woesebacteria bacterium]